MGLVGTPLCGETEFAFGPQDLITDVPGVKVGHCTVAYGDIQTGVTALVPSGQTYARKLRAASHVINGFGKTAGLVQINELGQLETPILLTNTLSVGVCWQALCRRMVIENPLLKTVNPVVCECNDSFLNDIRAFSVSEDMVFAALDAADASFLEGAVGAGRGMVCHGLSGGIGSASRRIEVEGAAYTLGAMVLANHGRMDDLMIHGDPAGRRIRAHIEQKNAKTEDVGSVITVLATDIPLSSLQLQRVCRRAVAGLSRTGSKIGHGSGEIVLAFTTANRIEAEQAAAFSFETLLSDRLMDAVFRMTAETAEESVLSALWHAERVTGVNRHTAESLRDMLMQ